ncbi:hypothetical protein Godav_026399, partial [Gossypium davidsonii]|nr:hypothetical protein [Gossypium davidsonii]MBA0652202.1 hypothetical protein [Gossypium klotzschianum]
MLKCNVDASRLDRDNIVELVAIIRDSHGREIKCFSGFEKAFLYSPCLVEVFAIREVLSWLKSLRLDDVIIESDSQVLVIIEGGLGLRDLESGRRQVYYSIYGLSLLKQALCGLLGLRHMWDLAPRYIDQSGGWDLPGQNQMASRIWYGIRERSEKVPWS